MLYGKMFASFFSPNPILGRRGLLGYGLDRMAIWGKRLLIWFRMRGGLHVYSSSNYERPACLRGDAVCLLKQEGCLFTGRLEQFPGIFYSDTERVIRGDYQGALFSDIDVCGLLKPWKILCHPC